MFSNGVALSLFVRCQGLWFTYIFSCPADGLFISSQSLWLNNFFFNLQRSRVYQSSVCRWCFWCQLLRISFPSHRSQRIFLKNIFKDVYVFCTLYLSLHSLFRAGGVGGSVVRATHSHCSQHPQWQLTASCKYTRDYNAFFWPLPVPACKCALPQRDTLTLFTMTTIRSLKKSVITFNLTLYKV